MLLLFATGELANAESTRCTSCKDGKRGWGEMEAEDCNWAWRSNRCQWTATENVRATETVCLQRAQLSFVQTIRVVLSLLLVRGYHGGSPTAVQAWQPALCGSCPLVTPYYCRLGHLLCFVFMSAYCMFDLSVYCVFLQYFDTVGWVFWPVKTVSHITYTVLAGT